MTLSHWDCLLTANIPYAKAFEYPPIDSKRINLQFDPVELEISQVIHQQATEITNLTLTPQNVLAACYCPFKSAPSSYSTTFIKWTCCDQACFSPSSPEQTAIVNAHDPTNPHHHTILILFGQVSRFSPLSQATRPKFRIPPSLGFQIPSISDSKFRQFRILSDSGFLISLGFQIP